MFFLHLEFLWPLAASEKPQTTGQYGDFPHRYVATTANGHRRVAYAIRVGPIIQLQQRNEPSDAPDHGRERECRVPEVCQQDGTGFLSQAGNRDSRVRSTDVNKLSRSRWYLGQFYLSLYITDSLGYLGQSISSPYLFGLWYRTVWANPSQYSAVIGKLLSRPSWAVLNNFVWDLFVTY